MIKPRFCGFQLLSFSSILITYSDYNKRQQLPLCSVVAYKYASGGDVLISSVQTSLLIFRLEIKNQANFTDIVKSWKGAIGRNSSKTNPMTKKINPKRSKLRGKCLHFEVVPLCWPSRRQELSFINERAFSRCVKNGDLLGLKKEILSHFSAVRWQRYTSESSPGDSMAAMINVSRVCTHILMDRWACCELLCGT